MAMKNNKKTSDIAIYQAPNGAVEVRVDKHQETIKLTQQQVGQLFNVQRAAISKHVKNIFDTGELNKNSTVSILETVQTEGNRKIKRKIILSLMAIKGVVHLPLCGSSIKQSSSAEKK